MSDLLQLGRPMRASVDAKAFSDALSKTALVLRKLAIPVLSETTVRFSNGRCILTATDVSTWITVELPADGDDFSFTFSQTKKVVRVCRGFEGRLTLEWMENIVDKDKCGLVRLSCGSRTGEFDAYSVDISPNPPKVDSDVSFQANAAHLLERITKVAYATIKPEQCERERSACVEFSGSQVFALDGYRAAWDNGESDFPQPFLVHAAPLRCLKAFGNCQVDLRLSKSRLSVTDGTMTIIFHTVDSKPFHLERALPKKYLEEFSVSPKEFLAELRYLKDIIPKTRTPYVYLRRNELLMPVNGKIYGTAITISRTGDTTVGLNLHYLHDALMQFRTEKRVTVKISGLHSPIVIEAEGRSDCAMVLPVRAALDATA